MDDFNFVTYGKFGLLQDLSWSWQLGWIEKLDPRYTMSLSQDLNWVEVSKPAPLATTPASPASDPPAGMTPSFLSCITIIRLVDMMLLLLMMMMMTSMTFWRVVSWEMGFPGWAPPCSHREGRRSRTNSRESTFLCSRTAGYFPSHLCRPHQSLSQYCSPPKITLNNVTKL